MRETSSLEPDRDPEEILAEVREEKVEAVLLVGHEPHLGALLGRLLFGKPGGPSIPMKKAAVARLEWGGSGEAALKALLPARILGRIGSAEE